MKRLSPTVVAGIILLSNDARKYMLMTGVIEEINIIPFKKVVMKKNRPEKIGFSFYINRHKCMIREMSFPDEPQKLPVDEWIMPVQPQGYIKCKARDFL